MAARNAAMAGRSQKTHAQEAKARAEKAKARALNEEMSQEEAATRIAMGYRARNAKIELEQRRAENRAVVQVEEVVATKAPSFPDADELAGVYLLQGRWTPAKWWPQLVTWDVSSATPCPFRGKKRPALCLTQRVNGCPCACSYLCECDDGLYGSPLSCFPCLMVYGAEEVGVCFLPFLVHGGKKDPSRKPADPAEMQRM